MSNMNPDQIATARSFLVLVRNRPGTALLLGRELFDLIDAAQRIAQGIPATDAEMIKVAKATMRMCDMLG